MPENKNIKRENFIRISENRVSKILVLFDQLKNLRNKSFYEYDNDDIERIFYEIEKEMQNTKEILIRENNKKRFEL